MKVNNMKTIFLVILLSTNLIFGLSGNWQTGGSMGNPVAAAVSSTYGKTVYIFGGFSLENEQPERWISRFQVDQWLLVSNTVSARDGLTGAADDTSFYYFGGRRDISSQKNYLERYSLELGGASVVADSHLVFDRINASCQIYNNKLYIIGGNPYFENEYDNKYIEKYDLITGEVTVGNDDLGTATSLPSLQMTVKVDSLIYIFGGFNVIVRDRIYKYNMNTDSLIQLDARLSTPRVGGAAVLDTIRNYIYVIGGFNESNTALGIVEVFDIYSESMINYFSIPDMNIARSRFSAEIVDDEIIVSGGYNSSSEVERTFEIFDISDVTGLESVALNPKFELYKNYPNPFNPSTKIRYEISEQTNVTLEIFDVTGRRIAVLVDKTQPRGIYEATFKADNNLASGIYFYKLQAGNFSKTEKMLLLK